LGSNQLTQAREVGAGQRPEGSGSGSSESGLLRAEIIAIGDELLLGTTLDTNSKEIARMLRLAGLGLGRVCTVGDEMEEIVAALRESMDRADLVICTGGLGPTADDLTREAVARALGRRLEFRPELWEEVRAVFARYGSEPGENNRQQAFLPEGAVGISNPVGTAPAFRVEVEQGTTSARDWKVSGRSNLVALPGVPREMRALMEGAVLPWIRERYGFGGAIAMRVLHTAGVGESRIDERVRDLQLAQNPDLGLAAHAGQVDLRITARAESEAAAWAMVAPVEAEVRARLGDWIYGMDGETLADVVGAGLANRGWRILTLEAGTGGRLAGALSESPMAGAQLERAEVRPALGGDGEMRRELERLREAKGVALALGLALHLVEGRPVAEICLVGPEGAIEREISHGGPPESAARRAVSYALEMLRGQLG
jgi:competence/damage-inducible protein CinA-like protein